MQQNMFPVVCEWPFLHVPSVGGFFHPPQMKSRWIKKPKPKPPKCVTWGSVKNLTVNKGKTLIKYHQISSNVLHVFVAPRQGAVVLHLLTLTTIPEGF